MFQFLFCYILERKDKKWFKRDIIVLISFLILFVSISFLVNIGKEMSLPGFRTGHSFLLMTACKLYENNKLTLYDNSNKQLPFYYVDPLGNGRARNLGPSEQCTAGSASQVAAQLLNIKFPIIHPHPVSV